MTIRLSRPVAALAAIGVVSLAPAPLAAQGTASTAARPEARPISLDEAMRLADRNAPQTVQARGAIRTSRASATSAFGAFLPSISLGASTTRTPGGVRFNPQTEETIDLPTTWQYGDNIGAQLRLFDGGQRWFDLRQARQNVTASEASDVAARYTVRLNVAQQYYNVLAARESEAAALAQRRQAEQQFRVSAARVAAGAATRSDSLRAIIQVGNARLALATAQNARNAAEAALTRLVASPTLVTASPADTLQAPGAIPDSAMLVRLAEGGPLVDQARAQHRAAEAGERSAWTNYLPTVNASVSRSRSGTDETLRFAPDPIYNSQFRLSFSFPLFDGFQREQQRVLADVQEDNAQAQYRDARLLAQQSLVQSLGTLRTAQERIDIQLASVAAAEEDLRVQEQRYALGASTQLDVLTSQTQLNQARAQLIQARYDYRVARAQIEALIGQALP